MLCFPVLRYSRETPECGNDQNNVNHRDNVIVFSGNYFYDDSKMFYCLYVKLLYYIIILLLSEVGVESICKYFHQPLSHVHEYHQRLNFSRKESQPEQYKGDESSSTYHI